MTPTLCAPPFPRRRKSTLQNVTVTTGCPVRKLNFPWSINTCFCLCRALLMCCKRCNIVLFAVRNTVSQFYGLRVSNSIWTLSSVGCMSYCVLWHFAVRQEFEGCLSQCCMMFKLKSVQPIYGNQTTEIRSSTSVWNW